MPKPHAATLAAWYVPSWNGDLRLEPATDNPEQTILTAVDPTPAEEDAIRRIGELCLEKRFVEKWELRSRTLARKTKTIMIRAPIATLGALVVPILRPGPAVLTAVRFEDGRVVTSDSAVMANAASDPATTTQAPASPASFAGPETPSADATTDAAVPKTAADATAAEPKTEPKAKAATVRRATPSCPQCQPGAVEPASEVLLSFLTPEEHRTWAAGRFLVVEGGLTGHRYLLAHRHSPLALRVGRICYDLDDRAVVHFHDWRVPPEEEVLGAKLVLQHREAWLRNEATLFDAHHAELVLKNPFGDVHDGVADAQYTQRLGVDALREIARTAIRAGLGELLA